MEKGAGAGTKGGRGAGISAIFNQKSITRTKRSRHMDGAWTCRLEKAIVGGGKEVVQSQVEGGSACALGGCELKKVNADLGQQLACGDSGRLI